MAAGSRSGSRALRLGLVALGLAVLVTSLPPLTGSASAQEVVRRRNLFDLLFGGPPPREALPAAPRRPAARQERPPQQERAPAHAAPAAPAAPTVEKLENARVVLVVGDFLAAGLAEGLKEAYAESPGVVIVDRSNGSSGFVRDDYYDWNGEIGPILEEVDPAVVVVMIGSNDRQQLIVGGARERPQTEPWLKEYTQRVTTFAGTVEATGTPIVWTGLPPFKSSSMSSDMLAFNDIHKQAAEAAGGTFVDIWEGFVDENGAFVFTGPDMNGQPVRLRGSDGINLTRAGKRKVAFYVEKPLNKLLGGATDPDIEQLDMENLPPLPGLEAGEPVDLDRTPPVLLAAPELDGGGELLGGEPVPAADRERQTPSRPGRADHFSIGGEGAAPVTEDATGADDGAGG